MDAATTGAAICITAGQQQKKFTQEQLTRMQSAIGFDPDAPSGSGGHGDLRPSQPLPLQLPSPGPAPSPLPLTLPAQESSQDMTRDDKRARSASADSSRTSIATAVGGGNDNNKKQKKFDAHANNGRVRRTMLSKLDTLKVAAETNVKKYNEMKKMLSPVETETPKHAVQILLAKSRCLRWRRGIE